MTDTVFCGIPLEHPIINGSGTFDAIAARRVFGDALDSDFPFAAFVTKTVTCEPRQGNPPPRLWETPAGMINSIGLPNKGLELFIKQDLPQLKQLPVPIIVNVMGFSRTQFVHLLSTLSRFDEIPAFELNVSCPNVKTGLVMGADRDELLRLLEEVRPLTSKPLIVKLTPNCASPAAMAQTAVEGGADAISLINTLTGMPLHPSGNGRPWLGGRTGGQSGPAVRAVAMAQVGAVAERVSIPIVAMGGVQSGAHANDFLSLGATLVAVGTETFREPLAGARVRLELEALKQPQVVVDG